MKSRAASPLTVAAAVLTLGAAVSAQVFRDRTWPRDVQDRQSVLYVPSGPALQRLALEFDPVAADIYWIRALQHYGGERLASGRPRNYDLLYPLLDITTSLDPYFTIAYRFGAIFLSEPYPGGPGRPDLAIKLLEKGIEAQPTKWQYRYDIAFVHYWHHQNYRAAAEWFRRASEQPGAPNWLQPLVAVMLNAGGDRSSARLIWSRMLEADQEWLQRLAARRLRQLDALDQIDLLQPLVARAPPAPGERYGWERLVRARLLRGIPLDPTGVPYAVDPDTGAVSVAPDSDLQPMPHEGQRKLAPR